MLKKEAIVVRVSPELREQVKKKADDVGLAVSTYVRTLIVKDLK